MGRINIAIPGVICDGVLYAYGATKDRKHAEKIISSLPLTGCEEADRLLIQDAIDTNRLKAAILYNGNTVYPFDRHVKEYKRLLRHNDLGRMSKSFYSFLHLACGDIAHYDYGGYIAYYDGDFSRVDGEIIQKAWTPGWRTDVQRIFDAIQVK